jgi:hypothetical protein
MLDPVLTKGAKGLRSFREFLTIDLKSDFKYLAILEHQPRDAKI